MNDALVVNASPHIFLANAGLTGLLQALGTARVVVPEAVALELARGGHE